MKRKIIIGMIFCIILILNSYKVQAYSGEIDPKEYITLPSTIQITNGKGTGTISVSANGYNISYQKNDISESTFTSITSKNKEIETYVKTTEKEQKDKETNLTTLKTKQKRFIYHLITGIKSRLNQIGTNKSDIMKFISDNLSIRKKSMHNRSKSTREIHNNNLNILTLFERESKEIASKISSFSILNNINSLTSKRIDNIESISSLIACRLKLINRDNRR